jgi:putative DNA primase/helicase
MDRLVGVDSSNIPAELRSLPQWVLWKAEPRGGRVSKVPYRLDGRRASSTDPDDWTGFESACQAYVSGQGRHSGVGFVFTATDNICGVDLDHVIGGDGQTEPWVSRMVAAFDSYTEYSVSGQGLHIFARGAIPEGSRHRLAPVEIYDRGRFFTVTGRPYGEPKPLSDAQPEIDRLLKWMKPDGPRPQKAPPRVSPCPDDRKLLNKMASRKNGYKFARLWRGDTSDYGGDDSRADLALLSMLLFWTRGDEARADTLFRQSGLSRDKWTKRPDYRERCFRYLR